LVLPIGDIATFAISGKGLAYSYPLDIEPEYKWLLHRVKRLRTMLRYVKDVRVGKRAA
jgi:hypothetical protein